MNLNITCIRSHYPKIFGIRRTLQTLKVNRIRRYSLSDSEIAACEVNPTKIGETIKPYLEKYAGYLTPTLEEANYLIEHAPKYRGGGTAKSNCVLI